MNRTSFFCIILCLGIVIAFWGQTAIDPEDFSGQWYSSGDQNAYLFREGLIYNSKHTVKLSDSEFISGAYSYCKDSIFLFAEGIEGLETEKELYLVHKGDGSFLCENKDGSGTIYFIRYNK